MRQPLQMDFGSVPASATVKAAIRTCTAGLSRSYPDLLGCRVALGSAAPPAAGSRHVEILLSVPGDTIRVDHAAVREDLDVAVWEAFDQARHCLEHWAAQHRAA